MVYDKKIKIVTLISIVLSLLIAGAMAIQSNITLIQPESELTTPLDTVGETFLDESNVQGSPGSQYWLILSPGHYLLTFSTDPINTNNNYAIRIASSDVILDGMGKTITGPGLGTVESGPSYYGIRVNSGLLSRNITIQNITVSNKNLGVVFEYVQGGTIRTSHFISNTQGITAWKCSNLNIQSNDANSNAHGIVLDANLATNDYFLIDSNNLSGNSQFGINLWLSNSHNIIRNNTLNSNNMGIVMTDGGTGATGTNNTLTNNSVVGNVNGLFLSNFSGNNMSGNSLAGNTNVGIWFDHSGNNKFSGNFINNSGWVGIYLSTASVGNLIYNNYFASINNEESDGTSPTNLNISPTLGKNIVNGPQLGGNFWSNPSGTGFSDACVDGDANGFCDNGYSHTGGLIDYYPLHRWTQTITNMNTGVFRPSTHLFYLRPGNYPTTPATTINWGISTDIPVTGDWNGDGITEVGVFRPSTHLFYLRPGNYPTTPATTINWGIRTDIPVIGVWG